MRVDFFYVYVLMRIVDEGGRDNGIKKGGGDTKGTVGRQDGEGLDVEVVGVLMWWWGG